MIRYLGKTEFADRIGVKRDTLNRYRLPPPDAMIGHTRGWLEKTIDDWNARRPGSGQVPRGEERWDLPPEYR